MTRKDEKRAHVLDAACQVIARHGLRKTTMEDIADKAGIKAGSLYYYFKSKEEIFAAAVRRESEAFAAQVLAAVDAAETPESKLVAFMGTRYSFLQQMTALYNITTEAAHELLPLAQQARCEFLAQELDLLKNILTDGVEAGRFDIEDTELVALAMLAGLRGMDSVYVTYGVDVRLEQGLPKLFKTLLYGVVVRAALEG